MKLKAKSSFVYLGKCYQKGEVFDINAETGQLFLEWGSAQPHEGGGKKEKAVSKKVTEKRVKK